ncbi:MAG: alginate O-acetyltransferase AlgX-related protein [Spirochaetota bacterium]
MRQDSTTSAILFLATVSAGLLFAAAGVLGGVGGGPSTPTSGGLSLVDGSLTAEVEDIVEEQHPLRGPAVSLVAAVRYVLFRDATGPAVVGRDGWLFTLEEFERRPGDDERIARRIDEIGVVAGRLESMGIDLAVVFVPSKARVFAQRLPVRWRSLAEHPRLDAAVEELRRRRLTVVDLRDAFGEGVVPSDSGAAGAPLFFARDTHWTPEGARRAAAAVAREARRAGLAPDASATDYVRIAGEPAKVPGDLMSFLPVGRLRAAFGLQVEEAVPARAAPESGSTGGAGGLFGQLDVPVALVGTSYSRDERWGFAEELKLAFDADVLNVASEGEGPFEPMREYLEGETIRDPKPELVVWEIPERYLTLPVSGP